MERAADERERVSRETNARVQEDIGRAQAGDRVRDRQSSADMDRATESE